MFSPAPAEYGDFVDSWRNPDGLYALRDVRLKITSPSAAEFSATVDIPRGASAWARCWVSNAIEGGLAEEEVSGLSANNPVQFKLELNSESVPELACIRIESDRFETQHVLHTRLCKGELYFLDKLRFELDSINSLNQMIANMPDEIRKELSPRWLKMVEEATEPIAWIHGFKVHDRETNEHVGSGGFKGPPADGIVEIAYGIDEPFRGRGYATTVAKALTNYAFGQSSDVKKVIAHTLPEENASTTVLTKAGFTKVGEVTDPDDGPVWRWEQTSKSC